MNGNDIHDRLDPVPDRDNLTGSRRVLTYSRYADCEKARNEWLQGPVLSDATVKWARAFVTGVAPWRPQADHEMMVGREKVLADKLPVVTLDQLNLPI